MSMPDSSMESGASMRCGRAMATATSTIAVVRRAAGNGARRSAQVRGMRASRAPCDTLSRASDSPGAPDTGR